MSSIALSFQYNFMSPSTLPEGNPLHWGIKRPVIAKSEVVKLNNDEWAAHKNSSHIPNDETLAAIKEGDEILERAKRGLTKQTPMEDFFKGLGL